MAGLVVAAVISTALSPRPTPVEAAPSQSVADDCARGQSYLKVDRDEDAVEAFEAGLEKNPRAKCAIKGLEEATPGKGTQLSEEITQWIADGLVYVGLALLLGFAVLLLGYQPQLGPWMRRIWGVRRILAPRLTIEALEDEAVEGKPGAPFTARIKERLRRSRDEAESEEISAYNLDFGTPGEEFVDVVSANDGLKSSLEKASEVSGQTKIVGAVLNVLYALLPVPRFAISGAVEPPSSTGAAATLILEKNARLESAMTLRDRTSRTPHASDYVHLADPAAVWIQYEIARVLGSKSKQVDGAEAWLLVRKGLDHYNRGEMRPARASFVEAERLHRSNWAAVLGMAMTEARLGKRYCRSISLLRRGITAMEKIETDERSETPLADISVRGAFAGTRLGALVLLEDPTKDAAYLADPDYYRLGYQLVAQCLNGLYAASSKEVLCASEHLDEALSTAKLLLRQSRAVRRWLLRRSERPGWRLWNRKLSAKEERLLRFLSGTVEPSLEIAIAAGRRASDKRVSRETVRGLHERAEKRTLSYRALYSLACFEARDENDTKEALRYLGQALRRAPSDRATELWRWATKDPSLAKVRGSDEFSALRSAFGA